MNLPAETRSCTLWLARLSRQFLRVRPGTTVGLVAALSTAKITKILAFFLPLKVILLAGSDGVPRYFPFVDPADKMGWIIGFSIGAIVAYLLTLALETISARLARGASGDILQGATELSVYSQQDRIVQDAYSDTCGIAAAMLFVGMAMLVLLIVNPVLAGFLLAAVLIEYIVSSRILAGNDLQPGRLKAWVVDNAGDYLKILASINFLGGFLVILAPFLIGAGGNIILALLGIILSRQSMNTLARGCKDAAGLFPSRHRIDPLVFRHARVDRTGQGNDERSLHVLFSKPARQARTAQVLREQAGVTGDIDVRWADSPIKGMATLAIHVNEGGAERVYQQQVFSPKQQHLLRNEELLFRYVDRDRLHAAPIVARFSEGPYECRIVDQGANRHPDANEWPEIHQQILTNLWSYVPPKRLVKAYRRSHPLLQERLTSELIRRISVAAESEQDRRALARLEKALPAIRARIASLPLVLHNADIKPVTTTLSNDGNVCVLMWVRWSLQPIGTLVNGAVANAALDAIYRQQSDTPTEEDVALARECLALVRNIASDQYTAALRRGVRVADFPVVAEASKAA